MTIYKCIECEKEIEQKKYIKYCSNECRHLGRLKAQKKYNDKFKKKIILDDNEEWKEIKGFEGLYFINKKGDVKGKNGLLKPSINKAGYKYVTLCKDSTHYTKTIHKLLGLAFIDNEENKTIIDHIDRNKLNNNLDNLRWATYKENANNSKNVLEKKGCICETNDNINNKIYKSFRLYYYVDNIRKSKRFKTRKEAEDFQNKILW